MIGHPSNWLSIMGSNLFHEAHALNVWLVKTILQPLRKYACSLTVISFRCLHHQAMSLWSMHNCFIPKSFATGATNCAMRRYPQESWHVFRVFLRNFDNDSYIVTKGAPVQSCRALTNHKSSQGVGWPTTSAGRVRLHFPSPNEQTVAAMGGNGNLLFMGLITICSSRIWILPACHIGLPEGTWILSGVLTVQLPTKDIDNIPARTCTNTPHWFPKACSRNL